MSSLSFGDNLELDLGAYELRRAGRAVRLERIPMEILILLVERRPDLVTREQIAERIWGGHVFVDTDNGINRAIGKVRQALRDDPDRPRYIRTVTTKGYRFIAAVNADGQAGLAILSPAPEATSDPIASPEAGALPVDVPAPAAGPGRRWTVIVGTVALAGIVGFTLLRWLPSPSGARSANGRQMLAVLPFDNLTGDPRQEYVSDGFTEEMITRVGAMAPKRLGVIARTSVMRYKQDHAPLDRLARELGVTYVLEGSLRRESQRVRITAQLIQIADQTHLWAQEYDRDPKDLLRVEDEIARAIADQIDLTLSDRRPPPVRRSELSPQDYEAYDLYLKGRNFLSKRTPDDLEQAISSFQQAISKRPDDARAYVGLADAYALMGTYSYAPPADMFPRAREAALKALEIDTALASAYSLLALINEQADWDWPTAGERFRKAVELDPNDATAHHWYAEYLALQGKPDEAATEIERARLLDPRSLIIATDSGVFLYFARDYDRAIERFRTVLAQDPFFPRANLIVAAYIQSGRYTDAVKLVTEWQRREDGPWPRAWAAHVYGRLGKPKEAQLALRSMEAEGRRLKSDLRWPRTVAYLGMGLRDQAFTSLQQGCDEHSNFLVGLKVDPIFDPLRDDPRFEALLRCAHL